MHASEKIGIEDFEKAFRLKEEGVRAYRKKDFVLALSSFEKVLEILPGDIEVLFWEALCLYHLGNLEKAEAILQKLLKVDTSYSLPALPKVYAYILLKKKRYKEGEDFLKKVLKERGEDLQLLNMLAHALERQNKLEEAEKILQKILSIHPENINALNSLAYVYYRQNKKLNEALDMVKKALAKEPDNPAYLDTFAMLLYKKGNTDGARRALQKALGKDPTNEELLEHLKEILKL